ncbi:unnamed protein product [Closterium sp. NIES-54]
MVSPGSIYGTRSAAHAHSHSHPLSQTSHIHPHAHAHAPPPHSHTHAPLRRSRPAAEERLFGPLKAEHVLWIIGILLFYFYVWGRLFGSHPRAHSHPAAQSQTAAQANAHSPPLPAVPPSVAHNKAAASHVRHGAHSHSAGSSKAAAGGHDGDAEARGRSALDAGTLPRGKYRLGSSVCPRISLFLSRAITRSHSLPSSYVTPHPPPLTAPPLPSCAGNRAPPLLRHAVGTPPGGGGAQGAAVAGGGKAEGARRARIGGGAADGRKQAAGGAADHGHTAAAAAAAAAGGERGEAAKLGVVNGGEGGGGGGVGVGVGEAWRPRVREAYGLHLLAQAEAKVARFFAADPFRHKSHGPLLDHSVCGVLSDPCAVHALQSDCLWDGFCAWCGSTDVCVDRASPMAAACSPHLHHRDLTPYQDRILRDAAKYVRVAAGGEMEHHSPAKKKPPPANAAAAAAAAAAVAAAAATEVESSSNTSSNGSADTPCKIIIPGHFQVTAASAAHPHMSSVLHAPMRDVLLVARRRRRLLLNEDSLVAATRAMGLPISIAVLEDLPLYEQIRAVRSCAILVGVHGSGLLNSMFLHPGSVLVQIVPYNTTGADRFYEPQVRQAGGSYMEVRVMNRSDSVFHWHLAEDHGSKVGTAEEREQFLQQGPDVQRASDVFFSFWVNQDVHVPVGEYRRVIGEAVAAWEQGRQQQKKRPRSEEQQRAGWAEEGEEGDAGVAGGEGRGVRDGRGDSREQG